MKAKKTIVVDLDVVTVSMWNKKGNQVEMANAFIDRVAKREFYVATPFFLLELVSKWKYDALKDKIENFYLKFTDRMLSNEDVDYEMNSKSIDDEKILLELRNEGIKGEDSLLALVASIFNADYLVTFNRIHLRSKENKINEVLRKNGLKTIKIIGPQEA